MRITFFLLLLFTLTGCSSDAKPQPLYIGHVFDSQQGAGAEQGVRLVVQDVNNIEDRNVGRPVEVIHVRAAGNRDVFAGEAVRLANINQVVALMGGQTMDEAIGLDQEWAPVVSPAGLRSPTMSQHTFLTGLRPSFQGQALARFAARHVYAAPEPAVIGHIAAGLGVGPTVPGVVVKGLQVQQRPAPRLLLLVDSRRPEFEQTTRAFIQEFTSEITAALGPAKRPRLDVWYYRDDVELVQHANNLDQEKIEGLLLAGDAQAFDKLRDRFDKPSIPLFYAGPDGSHASLVHKRQTGQTVYAATSWTPDADTKENRDFLKRYRETYQQEPDVYAALAFDNARILFAGIRNTEKFFTLEKIREGLREVKDFRGLTGTFSFDEDLVLKRPAFVIALRNGQAMTLEHYNP
jgi:ABC-type branched-subunit amino acid transport system substrate-binding protein